MINLQKGSYHKCLRFSLATYPNFTSKDCFITHFKNNIHNKLYNIKIMV